MSSFSGMNSGASTSRGPVTNNPFEDQQNKIFFVAILRNNETLVKFTEYSGNFDELLQQILPKIFKTNGIKMTFNYEEYKISLSLLSLLSISTTNFYL